MLPNRHRRFTLNSGSQYFGRVDPVRKVKLQSKEVVIECEIKQEIISLSSWETLEECLFCNAPTGYFIGGLPSRESTEKPQEKQPVPQYAQSRRNYRIQVLVALLLIACLGIGGGIVYFALNGSDMSVSRGLPTPEPITEVSVITQTTVEPSATFQPTIAATATLQPTAITPLDPLGTITEYVALLNNRQYEQAFAILSDDFKRRNHCCEVDGSYSIQPYLVYWQTVERLILVDLFLESQSDSQAIVYSIWRFERVNTGDVVLRFRITLHYEDRWKIERVVSAKNES